MESLSKQVNDYTESYAVKIDRLIKDVAVRFKSYSQLNHQVQFLQSNFNQLQSSHVEEKKTNEKSVQDYKKQLANYKSLESNLKSLGDNFTSLNEYVRQL